MTGDYCGMGQDVWYTGHHYGAFNTEPRIASYLGIASGQIPPKHYFGTFRTFPNTDNCDWAWTEQEPSAFLAASAGHRWAVLFRIEVLFGLRRSELLALRWDDVDEVAGTLRIDEGLVPLRHGIDWTPGKSARSRRTIALDPVTRRMLGAHRAAQAEDRLKAGPSWEDNGLLCCSRTGTP